MSSTSAAAATVAAALDGAAGIAVLNQMALCFDLAGLEAPGRSLECIYSFISVAAALAAAAAAAGVPPHSDER